MCAAGPAPLQCRGAGRARPPMALPLSAVLKRRSARPVGASAVRDAAAAAGSVEAAPHPHPLGAAGAELPGSTGASLPGGRACCEVGMWVALSSPSSLPLFPRRRPPVGVDLMFLSVRPLLGRSWAGAPAPSPGLLQSRRGERALLGRAGLPTGCPAGRGAPSGAFPLTRRTFSSSGCAAPPLGVVSTASRLPCPGWDRSLTSQGETVS